MSKRGLMIWMLSCELPKKTKTKMTNITLTFFVLLVHVWLETIWQDIIWTQHQKQTKTKRVVFQKIQKRSLSDQILSFCQTFAPTQPNHCCRSYSYNRCCNKHQRKECQNNWQTQKAKRKKTNLLFIFLFQPQQKSFWSILVLIFLFHHFEAIDCLFELKENKTEKQNRKTNDMNKSTRKNEQTQRRTSSSFSETLNWNLIFLVLFWNKPRFQSNKCSFSNLSKECQTKSQFGEQGSGFDCIWHCCECVDGESSWRQTWSFDFGSV